MDKQITNKIVTIENILRVATLIEEHNDYYRDLISKEEIKYQEAQARDEYYTKQMIEAKITYGITFNNNETIHKTNEFDWFRNTLSANTKNIKEITINSHAYADSKSESVYITFTQKRIDLSSNSMDIGENETAHQVESYLNSLPPRFDELVVKDNRRKIIPALSISLVLGILGALVFFVLCKIEIITLSLEKLYIGLISAGILLGVAFFGSLLIPTSNHSLYRNHIKFERYYAGYDDQYNSIYKNDYAQYKNECEVCIGENADMANVRQRIEKNYKIAKKSILIEVAIAIVVVIVCLFV